MFPPLGLIILSVSDLRNVMPPTLLFLMLLVLTFGVAFYLLRPTKTETAVQQRLEDIQDSRVGASSGSTILKEEGYSRNPTVAPIIKEIPGALGTLKLVRQSGLNWT